MLGRIEGKRTAQKGRSGRSNFREQQRWLVTSRRARVGDLHGGVALTA
jgi:hypothetical protein